MGSSHVIGRSSAAPASPEGALPAIRRWHAAPPPSRQLAVAQLSAPTTPSLAREASSQTMLPKLRVMLIGCSLVTRLAFADCLVTVGRNHHPCEDDGGASRVCATLCRDEAVQPRGHGAGRRWGSCCPRWCKLGTVRMAKSIIVLEQGQIVERGSHDFLLAKDGKYARMFKLQAQGYQ